MYKYKTEFNHLLVIIFSILLLPFYLMLLLKSDVQAQLTPSPTPPPEVYQFPLCENMNEDGDVHYDDGWHQIAGGSLLWGIDDVYSLGDNYYLQCFCSPEYQGIQTNWTPVEEGMEWGPIWGLPETYYDWENREYYCGVPTITPTPTSAPCVGCGGSSAPVCTDTVPPAPKIVSVTSLGNNTVHIVWSKVTPANSYSIMYGTNTGEYPYSVFSTGDTDNFIIKGVATGCFTVKAVNGCMPGPQSPELCTGSVLGASTLGDTGGFAYSFNTFMLIAGISLTLIGFKKLAFNRL